MVISLKGMNSDAVCGLLAEPDRLRAYSAVVLGGTTPAKVAELSGLELPVVHKALQRLEKGGLIASADHAFRPRPGVFKEAVRSALPDPADRVPLDADPARDAVLRGFIRDGTLTVMPTVAAKLRIVLEYIAESFRPGQDYPERTVNEMLNRWHPDHAMLRRHLVEAGLVARDDGIYRRAVQS